MIFSVILSEICVCGEGVLETLNFLVDCSVCEINNLGEDEISYLHDTLFTYYGHCRAGS